MTHLMVKLYDEVEDRDRGRDRAPYFELDERNERNFEGFVDLNIGAGHDKAAKVEIFRQGSYHRGDHIRLWDAARAADSRAVSIDPEVSLSVDLNDLDFADKAAGLEFVLNPTDGYRLRVKLYDKVNQELPNLILYDWEFAPRGLRAELTTFHFADKAAKLIVEQGPDYVEGDRIRVWDASGAMETARDYPPGERDLNVDDFADRIAAVEFMLN